MNTTEIITFPELPTELIREIIEFAASSCTKTRLTFISVSSAIRFWTLPILYNTVVLRTASDVKSFWHTISSSPTSNPQLVPHIPLSMRVQHLAIFALGPLQSIEDIITRCENVQSLACGFSLSSYAASNLKLPTAATIHEFPAQSQIRERHLLGSSARDGIPFPLLSQDTTHLHVQISSLQVLLSLLQIHEQLPVLTHLALRIPSKLLASRYSAALFFKSLQEYNENLRTILVHITDHSEASLKEWVQKINVQDAKVVVESASGSAVSHWDVDNVGNGSLWADADAEVERRLKDSVQVCS